MKFADVIRFIKKNKIAVGIGAGVVFVAIIICVIIAGRGKTLPVDFPMYDDLEPAMGVEIFEYKYREDVASINKELTYNIVEMGDTFTVTIHNPDNQTRALAVGDTFVFEPTVNNPDGLAGHVVSIGSDGDALVITARFPKALDEIFDEFEFVGDIDMLAEAVEILVDEEIEGISGIGLRRNPTRLVAVDFSNANIKGIEINGELIMYTPRLNVSIGLNGVNHLVVTMAAETNIKVEAQLEVDKVINLFTIPVSLYGVRIDVPVGLRISNRGQASLEFFGRVDSQFGIRNNKASAQINITHTFNSNFNARVELSINVQAKASVLLVPVYGIQGDFGKGVVSSTEMQDICPENCFVIGLFDVRRISSLNWGVLGWIPALQFNQNLAPSGDYSFRYRLNGSWYNSCPHITDVYAPANVPPIGNTPPSSFVDTDSANPNLGEPVTLEEAQKTPGLYVKNGDRFILVKQQWTLSPSGYSSYSVSGNFVSGLFAGSASDKMAILFNSDFQMPQIPNTAQLVLIGITNIHIYEPFEDGWAIPHGVNLGQGRNSFGVSSGSEKVALLDYTSTWSGTTDAWFDTLNGQEPLNFQERMVYTRRSWGLMPFHGLLTGTRGEQYTFARWEGTDWVETTFAADRKFFTFPSQYSYSDTAIQANYEIVKTDRGYFEVNFLTRPVGYYGISSSGMHHIDRMVEFVE